MSLASFQQPKPSFLAQFDAFAANVEHRHRFLLTFNDGAHLVGVPTVRSVQDPTNADATFDVITTVASYAAIPFRLLAYAQQLVEPGLRASDGQVPVPEPCRGPHQRTKHDKFQIVDSPRFVTEDLKLSNGLLGVAVLYADVDHFKALNTQYTERVIDRTVLPELQRLVAASVEHRGHAYAEGGDEIIIVLPNTSIALAAAFSEELRGRVGAHSFEIDGADVRITLSIGLTSGTSGLERLPDWANLAKVQAKDRGRNRTVTTLDGVIFLDVGGEPPQAPSASE